MGKILKLEDVTVIRENDRQISRYVFNDDKIVRVDTESDEVLTKDVPERYLSLISYYSSATVEKTSKRDLIKSGKGAGWGVFAGLLFRVIDILIMIPLVHGNALIYILLAYFAYLVFAVLAEKYLVNISDKSFLKNEAKIKEINFWKGFYPTFLFGWIVAYVCCVQWKDDMLSVYDGKPNKYSKNMHKCFLIWEFIIGIIPIVALIIKACQIGIVI